MASPTIATNSGTDNNASSVTATLPTHAADDVLIAIFVYASDSGTWSTPSGWSSLFDTGGMAGFYLKATSGSTTDPTSSGPGTNRGGWFTAACTGAEDPATQAPEATTATGGPDTNPNPPNITPTGGSKDYLILAACAVYNQSAGAPTTGPSGYTLDETFDSGGGARGSCGGLASDPVTGSSEDPGTFALGEVTSTWDTVTIAVHPPAPAGDMDATLAGTGTLTAAITGETTLAGTLSGAGTLSAAITGETTLASTLSGTGTLTAVITGETTLASTLSGTGTLSLAEFFFEPTWPRGITLDSENDGLGPEYAYLYRNESDWLTTASESFTICGWAKFEGVPQSSSSYGQCTLAASVTGEDHSNQIVFVSDDTGSGSSSPWTVKANASYALTGDTVTTSRRIFYAYVYDHDAAGNDSLTFYADDGDGSLTAGTTFEWSPGLTLDDVTIGWNKWNGEGTNATYTNYKVWKRPLSSSELLEEMHSEDVVNTTSIWAHWTLRAPGDLADRSGQNHPLSLYLAGGSSTATHATMVVESFGLTASLDGVATLIADIEDGAPDTISATFSGIGTLAATITGETTLASTLAGAGTLAATITGETTLAGTLAGAGTLAATITGETTLAGTLAGAGTLAATITGETTLAGTLAGTGTLAAAITGETTLASTLAGAGTLVADVKDAAADKIVATLTGTGTLAATITGETTLAGTLSGAGTLAATITGETTLAGVLAGAGTLAATITGETTLAGTLSGAGTLAANVIDAAADKITATLSGAGTLAATITGETTLAGVLAGAGTLAATITGETTLAGTLSGAGTLAANVIDAAADKITATLSGAGTLAAAITGETTLASTLAGAGTLAATITGETTLAGTLAGAGTLAATITGETTLAGTLTGAGTLAATITGETTLAGTLSGAGTLAANVIDAAADKITATLSGAGTLAATITGETTLASTLAGAGTLAATITGETTLASTLAGAGTLVADVIDGFTLSATLSGAGTLSVAITGETTLAGVLSGTGSLTTNLSGIGELAGALSGTGTVAASIIGVGNIVALISGTSSLVAVIVGDGKLTISLAGVASLNASIWDSAKTIVASLKGVATITADVVDEGTSFVTIMMRNILVKFNTDVKPLLGVDVLYDNLNLDSDLDTFATIFVETNEAKVVTLGHQMSVRHYGKISVAIRTPVNEGRFTAVDTLAIATEPLVNQNFGVVTTRDASIRFDEDNKDFFTVISDIDFYAEDTLDRNDATGTRPAEMTYTEIGDIVSTKYAETVATTHSLLTGYDNWSIDPDADDYHSVVNVDCGFGQNTDTSNMYRRFGYMNVMLGAPHDEGMYELWKICDSIYDNFTAQEYSGITFLAPSFARVGVSGAWWQVTARCPFYVDSLEF